MKEILLREQEMVFLVLLYCHNLIVILQSQFTKNFVSGVIFIFCRHLTFRFAM